MVVGSAKFGQMAHPDFFGGFFAKDIVVLLGFEAMLLGLMVLFSVTLSDFLMDSELFHFFHPFVLMELYQKTSQMETQPALRLAVKAIIAIVIVHEYVVVHPTVDYDRHVMAI